jgi:hypothetical protein
LNEAAKRLVLNFQQAWIRIVCVPRP